MKRDLFNNKNNNIKIDQDILEIKLDKQVEQTLKDLHAKGFKEARKIDVLVICFQDAYVNKISKNNATVKSNIKKYMSKCIKHELSLILDNIMKNNKTNGINESQSLTEMKDENYLDEVLDIQFPDGRASSKKTRRSESERIKEKVQNYLDEYIEIKSNEINENDINSETQINKNDIEEVKEEIKEDKFFNTVKKHTDNFKFLAYSCDYYNSQIGKKRLPKFETVDDYYKFYEIQKMLKTKMKGIKTKKANLGELQVINLILVTENNLDETTQKVLKARKTVIEQELNKENRLLMNEER